MVMGRLVPGPDGLPQIGQSVRKGQVLAYIEPASGVLERSGQMAQVAELRAGRRSRRSAWPGCASCRRPCPARRSKQPKAK